MFFIVATRISPSLIVSCASRRHRLSVSSVGRASAVAVPALAIMAWTTTETSINECMRTAPRGEWLRRPWLLSRFDDRRLLPFHEGPRQAGPGRVVRKPLEEGSFKTPARRARHFPVAVALLYWPASAQWPAPGAGYLTYTWESAMHARCADVVEHSRTPSKPKPKAQAFRLRLDRDALIQDCVGMPLAALAEPLDHGCERIEPDHSKQSRPITNHISTGPLTRSCKVLSLATITID